MRPRPTLRPTPAHPGVQPAAARWKTVLALALVVAAAGPTGAAPSAWPAGPVAGVAVDAGALRDVEPPGPPPGLAGRTAAPALPGRAGRLVDFQGAVWVFDVAQGRWEEALRNRALSDGDRLSTGPDGRAELRIGSTELRLGPRTELEFVDVAEDRLVWRLTTGTLAWRVRRHEIARESEVRAAGVRVRADGPGHFRLDVEDAVVWASAWRGSLRVDSGDQLVQVLPPRRAEFMRPGPGPGTAVTWSAPLRDAFSDWVARDEWRDDQLATPGSGYVSPEMTGAEDLDRHGRWERHPEFGMVWTPLVVAVGWEPFRHGRWMWHVRWGWTWVDAAPWGFAPFHYGRWVNWGGRWCWVPGPYVARPAFSPALVAWTGSPGSQVSVGVTLHGWQWAPLPPRYAPPPPRWLPPEPVRRPPDRHWRSPAPDERAFPVRPPHAMVPPESVHPVRPVPPGPSGPSGPSARPDGPAQPAPSLQPPAPRQPPVAALPPVPAPPDAVERRRRPTPGERPHRGEPGEAGEGARGGGAERSNREERPEGGPGAAPPLRARVPESMRDRPRERQQAL